MWCDTALQPRFFFLDARSMFPAILFGLHMARWTFLLAVVGMLVFWFMGRWGVQPMMVIRMARSRIIGPFRTVNDTSIFRRRVWG